MDHGLSQILPTKPAIPPLAPLVPQGLHAICKPSLHGLLDDQASLPAPMGLRIFFPLGSPLDPPEKAPEQLIALDLSAMCNKGTHQPLPWLAHLATREHPPPGQCVTTEAGNFPSVMGVMSF